ncbi:MAG: TonB family protein, partial [Candidatus Sulfotelmatobacter sp.]
LLALVLLLVALTIVVVKDREFWFSPDEAADADSTPAEAASVPATATATAPVPSSAVSPVIQMPKLPVAPAKKQITAKSLINKPSGDKASTVKAPTEPAIVNPGVVATNRTVLPPLSVEVVAGDTHHTLRPGSNAVKVEIPNSRSKPLPGLASSTALVSGAGPATNAAELESMSPGIATALDRSGSSSYPLLAQSARVEGSVVLQALIGSDGVIRDLRVLSGPAILASAAQQAVRQWRFKPYLQNGQAVETRANITVSFTIKVSDNSKSS